jgi:hypothetical protein
MAESRKDIENVEAWAYVIERLLDLIPVERRTEVLTLTTKNHEAERKERAANGSFYKVADIDWMASSSIRHWHTIARLKSLVVQVLTRDIKTNHSPEDAAKILFAPHPFGHGSRRLRDYLPEVVEPRRHRSQRGANKT